MYPWIRFAREVRRAKRLPAMKPGETHTTPITCLPHDLDYQIEMNNGRIITLFDLGRIPLFIRMGLPEKMAEAGWYGTIAGSSIRYRRRITLFQRLELRSRTIGADERFTYFEQALYRGDECCAHGLLRAAITTDKGIVPSREALDRFGFVGEEFALPDWAQAWADAEDKRPWPPMEDDQLHPAPKAA